ncbi:IclR family transcriptional regulator [Brevibacillus agri]|uniref:IclR family transcriptional regulator n=1 Tax=Brevibacillus TaxID=55080 RepID=UPI0012662DD3|nr:MULTISPECIES: IclR family transcriptional regulator [Brevibacillus]MCG5253344.1 IclR family transcriptional regulator [Brevibacillus agri]MED1642464.1 IclR family transcriptional regulator [Brevibacillus agri]MED1655253.1 IclR family transcriptional regulator [Brevibacillus agri]MED1687959.1 IclR family transcriptional regulator [Brevibacillus agri]MED1693054.1 IclR family transcriptional regulator [Brevibacillus agri]
MKQENSSVQAVDRALQLLQLVGESKDPISIVDLAEMSGMNRTTVWRLIGTLENHGYIERDPLTKGYLLGYAAHRLAAQAPQYGSLIRRARKSMEQLREQTQETVLLSVPKHYGTLTIDQIDPANSVRVAHYVNVFLPLHCTSNGKVLLSTFSAEELNYYLEQPLERITPNTITDPERLRQEIEKVKKLGYAIVLGELDVNENGISAPIFDKRNALVAFISVCGPNFRFTEEKVLACTEQLFAAARDIADHLQ